MTEEHETRTEFSAIPVVAAVFAVGGAVIVGIYVGLWAAIAVTVGLALVTIAGLVVWSTRRRHPGQGEAPHVQPRDDGRHRILVVADESCVSGGFSDELKAHAGERQALVFVTAPALESRFGLLAGDQAGYDHATRSLEDTLEALHAAGLPARGEIGASDPLLAADDGLRQFPADEIVFVTSPIGKANWLEDGVVGLAESRYDQPVSHIAIQAP